MAYVNLNTILYPKGAIYQSHNNTSPANLLGGTWAKLTDAANPYPYTFNATIDYAKGGRIWRCGDIVHISGFVNFAKQLPAWGAASLLKNIPRARFDAVGLVNYQSVEQMGSRLYITAGDNVLYIENKNSVNYSDWGSYAITYVTSDPPHTNNAYNTVYMWVRTA